MSQDNRKADFGEWIRLSCTGSKDWCSQIFVNVTSANAAVCYLESNFITTTFADSKNQLYSEHSL